MEEKKRKKKRVRDFKREYNSFNLLVSPLQPQASLQHSLSPPLSFSLFLSSPSLVADQRGLKRKPHLQDGERERGLQFWSPASEIFFVPSQTCVGLGHSSPPSPVGCFDFSPSLATIAAHSDAKLKCFYLTSLLCTAGKIYQGLLYTDCFMSSGSGVDL